MKLTVAGVGQKVSLRGV